MLLSECGRHRQHTASLERERARLLEEEKQLAEALARWQRAQQQAQQLHEQATATNAQGIIERLAMLKMEIGKLRRDAEELGQKIAVYKDRMGATEQAIANLEKQLADQAPRVAAARDALRAALEPVPADLDDYVYRTKQGQRGDPETLSERLQAARLQAERLDQQLRGRDGILRPEFASSYRFRVEGSGHPQVLTHDGKTLADVLHQREQQVEEWSDRQTKRLREVFESLLEKELIGRLSQDRRHLQLRIDSLNRRLESVTFGGNQYRISHSVRPESRWLEEGLRAQGLLAEEARQTLRESIENRAEMMEEGETGVPPVLDYRHWYDFDFRIARRGQGEAHSSDITRGSGGAQASYNYLLLFCLAANFFDESRAPIRLLVMDEAFHNLDADRKQRLLLAAKDLDLDLVIATPDIDGTTLGTDYDSTTVLVEKDGEDNVSLIPLIFEREENDLFAAPRGEAVIRSEPEE